ncbi:MAG: ATP-binding protein [Fimbriimonadales bacterium]
MQQIWALFDLATMPIEGTFEEQLEPFVAACAELFRASGASLFLADRAARSYQLVAKCGDQVKAPIGATIRAGQGIAGACIQSRKPMLVTDPSADPRLRDVAARPEIGSSMVVPIVVAADECLGVLNLSRGRHEPEFDDDDLFAAWSVVRYLGLALRNLTLLAERNRALREAERMRAEIQAVLSSLAVGVVSIDPDGTVGAANPEALNLLGGLELRPEDELGREILQLAEDVRASGRRQRVCRRFQDSQVLLLHGSSLPDGGTVVAIEDITESERSAREMARMKRLAEMGQMAAAIAHEIRNPLTGICGASQMLLEHGGQIAELAQIIHDEGERLNRLCTDFLNFAKPLQLNVQRCDLRNVVHGVVTIQRARAEQVGVRVVEILPEDPVEADVDSARLSQVLHNLVVNAIQACDPGGIVEVVLESDRLVVRDTGRGMSPETLSMLFTPFFTTKPKGNGLGLSTAKKILDAHGGSIDVRSELGQGTTFTIQWCGGVAA